MPDIMSLKSEIDRLREDARVRRQEAQKKNESALGDRAMGNEDGARAQEAQANKLYDEASHLESTVETTASELRYQEAQLEQAKRELNEEETRHKAKMKDLQHKIEDLEGGVGSYTPLF